MNAVRAKSILVQLFSASEDWQRLLCIIQMLSERLPTAVIVGATTMGEIESGCLLTDSTVLSVSFFAESRVTAVASVCQPGEEQAAGTQFEKRIEQRTLRAQGLVVRVTFGAAQLPAGRTRQQLAQAMQDAVGQMLAPPG